MPAWLLLALFQPTEMPPPAEGSVEQRALWERTEARTTAWISRSDLVAGLSPPPIKGSGRAVRSVRFRSGGYGPAPPAIELMRARSGAVTVRVINAGTEVAVADLPASAWDDLQLREAGALLVPAYKPWNPRAVFSPPPPLNTAEAHCTRLELRAFDDGVERRGKNAMCPSDIPSAALDYAAALMRLAIVAKPGCPTEPSGEYWPPGDFGRAYAAFTACFAKRWEGKRGSGG